MSHWTIQARPKLLKKNSKGGKAESSLEISKELLNSSKPSRMGLGRILIVGLLVHDKLKTDHVGGTK